LKAGHVEGDANLITGQNPQSTASVAKEIAMAEGEEAQLRKSQT
jgi:putative intracellular protease/amidase